MSCKVNPSMYKGRRESNTTMFIPKVKLCDTFLQTKAKDRLKHKYCINLKWGSWYLKKNTFKTLYNN